MGASNPSAGSLNPSVSLATVLNLTGATNLVWNALVDGDTTPDVSGGTFFKTANTGATLITDFDGNTDAWIVVRADDANTTIVHDATKIKLSGGISIPMSAGDVLMFAEDSATGVWYELPIR